MVDAARTDARAPAGGERSVRTVAVGEVELSSILDATGILGELGDLFPGVPADAWEPLRVRHPELFAGSTWRLPVTCYLIRAGATTVLVDLGAGPPGCWRWPAEHEGGLLAGLAELGVAPDAVDVVVLTHLHVDHVGWLSEGPFTRARHLAHPAALAHARAETRIEWLRGALAALEEAGRLLPVGPGDAVAPGVTVEELDGHYPGHVGLRIESGGASALLAADAAVHPLLLARPNDHYVSDGDAARSAATRRALVDRLADTPTLFACGHFPNGGMGRLRRRGAEVAWEAA